MLGTFSIFFLAYSLHTVGGWIIVCARSLQRVYVLIDIYFFNVSLHLAGFGRR